MLLPRRSARTLAVTLGGFLFGCLFVIVGTVVEALRHGQLDTATVLQVQRTTPLLWIINTSPFVLGVAASLMRPPRPLPQARMQRAVTIGLLAITLLPLSLLLGAATIVTADRQHFWDMRVTNSLTESSHHLVLDLASGQRPVSHPSTTALVEWALRSLADRYPMETADARRNWDVLTEQMETASTPDIAVAKEWMSTTHRLTEAVEGSRNEESQAVIHALALGSLSLLVMLVSGITLTFQWRATAAALLDSEARFKQLADITIEGVAITVDGTITDANRAFGELFGYSPVELVGMSAEKFTTTEAWATIQRQLTTTRKRQYESVGLRKNGTQFPIEVNMRVLIDDGERTSVITVRDISAQVAHVEEIATYQRELEAANARLATLATTDALTGVGNRRFFDERLAEELRRSTRYGDPLSLLLLDVDHFKSYNDCFGHPAGDEVLRRLAALLRAGVRETDIITRYGGEEFAIILTNTDAELACVIAERVRATVEAAIWPLRAVTLSIGGATIQEDISDSGHLIAQADVALYQAKAQGRNTWTHFALCPLDISPVV